VLLGAEVVVDATVSVAPDAPVTVFGSVEAGEFCDVTMNVTEPRITATEPRTAHDHQTP